MKLEWGKWYVAEVSNFGSNPIHKAIVHCISDGKFEMVEIRSYEDYKRVAVSDLNHFKLVSEITDMRR
jgi:hypothetical protein